MARKTADEKLARELLAKWKAGAIVDPTNVPTKFLAKTLGLSVVRISQMFADGTLKQNGKGRGKYDLFEAVSAYVEKYRQGGTASAKTKLAIQQERKLRLLNDREAGTLVPIDDAADAFLRGCLVWRSGASALPRRLANRLTNAKRAADVRAILTVELDGLLSEFEKPLQDYFHDAGHSFTVVRAGPNGASPAAPKDPGPVGKRRKNTTARKRGTRKVSKRTNAVHGSNNAGNT